MTETILLGDAAAVARATSTIRRGGLVAFPTDTVYGLMCDPWNEAAVVRVFQAKGRGTKAIPVLCADISAADKLVFLEGRARNLAEKHWPGPLTIVAPLRAELPVQLHQGTRTLAVRVPAHGQCRQLAEGVGGAVTGTSANLSGQPSCRTGSQVAASLGDRVDLVVDGGRLEGIESTVVRVGEGGVEVLREGSVRITEGAISL